MSTIASVDRIITLKNGQVDEVGSPAELAKSDGLYATLLDLQQSGDKAHKEKLAKCDIDASVLKNYKAIGGNTELNLAF